MGDIKEIKSIPVVSFALIVALVLAIIMLVIGIIMAILGISMYSMMPYYFNMMGMMNYMYAGMGVLYFVVIMPITVFICGFIISAFAAIIYNLLAPRIGGIKLGLE